MTPFRRSLVVPQQGLPIINYIGSKRSEAQMARIEEMVTNLSLKSRQWLWDLLDPRRDVDDEAGYPRISESIPAETYRLLYDREAIANRVVEVLPKESWQVSPNVYEDESAEDATPFENAWDKLGQNLSGEGVSWHNDEMGSAIWSYLLRADIMSGIGQFGIILLGVDDGADLSTPVDGATVLVNRAAVKVYKDVPIRRDGEPVLNEDGTEKTRKVQTGWRLKVTSYQKVTDSFMSREQEDYLLNQSWQKMENLWNPATGKKDLTIERLPLTDNEKAQIAKWAEERQEFIANWEKQQEATANGQQRRTFTPEEPADNAARSKPDAGFDVDKDRTPSSKAQTATEAFSGQTPSGGLTPVGVGLSSPGYGQDVSHMFPAQEAKMPGQLSGTEQQYFGVQFDPSEALSEKPVKRKLNLKFLRVFDESLVQVVRYEWNINNPRFGKPVMYRVTLNDPRDQHSGVGLPLATVFVHWTRVIHVADNLRSSEIFGAPRMRAVLNNVLGLRKLYAGSPEMYWRGAFPGISLETHPQLGGDVDVDTQANQDQMEQYFNGLQRYLEFAGMSAKMLSPTVVDPTPQITVQLEAICIQIACPVRVFKGSERGELASSQDDEKWNDRVAHRNNFHVTPRVIVPFVDRMILFGCVPEPESFTCEWPPLDSLGQKDKAGIALQLMQTLVAYVSGGVDIILPPADMYVRFCYFTEEEAQEMLNSAAKAREKAMDASQDQADDQDLEKQPPPGFQKPPPPPPTVVQAPPNPQDAKIAATAKAQAAPKPPKPAGGGGAQATQNTDVLGSRG